MGKDGLWTEKMQYVEDMALVVGQGGRPRMSGRIMAWLLICDPPHQSMTELADVLGASKGSISQSTQLLIQAGVVERIGLPGKRGDYFRIKPDALAELVKVGMPAITVRRQMAERGLKLLESEDPKLKERLQEFLDVYVFLEKELTEVIKRWERQQERRRQE